MALFPISGSIVAGQTMSNPISLNERFVWGITTGSNMTGSTFSFVGSVDNVTYVPVFDKTSTEVTRTATSGSPKGFALNPLDFAGFNWMKVREGTSASSVAQSGVDTLFTIATRNDD